MIRPSLLLSVLLLAYACIPTHACETCVMRSAVMATKELALIATPVTADANTYKRSKRNTLSVPFKVIGTLWVNPKHWSKSVNPVVDGADLELDHETGNAKIFGMSMKEFAPLDAVLEGFIAGAKENGQDVQIVQRDERKVNGSRVLCVQIEQMIDRIPVTMFVYFYTGGRGSIQLVATVASEIFEELRPEVEDAMNGLVIK